VQLPEHCEWLGGSGGAPAVAEPYRDGDTWTLLSRLSRELKVWIHGGSFYEQSENPGRVYNTTVVFDRDGRERARYRKIHLFDVTTADGAKFHESATVDPGDAIVTYDCRRPHDRLFDLLRRALSRTLPATGTTGRADDRGARRLHLLTGKDHWEVLLRSRAIGPNAGSQRQDGGVHTRTPAGERQSFGQSMIIDPWGTVVARVSEGLGSASAGVDMGILNRVRSQIPVAANKAISITASLAGAGLAGQACELRPPRPSGPEPRGLCRTIANDRRSSSCRWAARKNRAPTRRWAISSPQSGSPWPQPKRRGPCALRSCLSASRSSFAGSPAECNCADRPSARCCAT
jgi:nitrilase